MIRISENKIQNYERQNTEKMRALAPECTVLLKKDGTFPLQKAGKIAVYGSGIRHTIKGGTGSGDVNVRHFVNVEEGLLDAGFEITSNSWLNDYDSVLSESKKEFYKGIKEQARQMGISPLMLAIGRTMLEPEYDLPMEAEGDTAIYVLTRNSGEGGDRSVEKGDIALTETERRDILALNQKYEKFMLVLNVGGLVDIEPVMQVKNILLLGQLGSCTGNVLADLLLGKKYPSGKLTMTWADIEAYPSTNGFGEPDDTYYKEDIYVGYRFFDTVGKDVLYPFGYGLSYTEFEIIPEDFEVNGATISVTVSVKNIGNMLGKEVIQLYCSSPTCRLEQPYQELTGFEKTKELAAGESCQVTILFQADQLASYDEELASYIIEKGNYILRVGNQSQYTIVCGVIQVSEEAVTKTLRNLCVPEAGEQEKIQCTIANKNEAVSDCSCEIEDSVKKIVLNTEKLKNGEIIYQEEENLEPFIKQLTEEELAYICVGQFDEQPKEGSIIGISSSSVAGAAGETTHHLKETQGLESIVLADGPAGVRVIPVYKIVNGQIKGAGMSFGMDMMNYMEPEELETLFPMEPQPPEEINAPEYYQYCTALPIGTDLAQSFNKELAYVCGEIVGEEMQMFGIDVWLAPAMNIQRSPLCGRNFEYYSEDPLVSGLTAAAVTNGIQSHKGCSATIKHFACNNQETNRYVSNSVVSERAMREIYLRGFEICVKKAGPHAVMSSYNLINGEHTCTSRELLTDILRLEWGYEGLLMTDWLITTDMMNDPSNKYQTASAAGCIKAGNDLIMPGGKSDMDDMLDA